jgi:hypothetical protein
VGGIGELRSSIKKLTKKNLNFWTKVKPKRPTVGARRCL